MICKVITGDILKQAVISGSNNISNNRVSVDELNVFPVPDGDTGTNMSLTIGNAAKELNVVNGANVSEVSKTIAGAVCSLALYKLHEEERDMPIKGDKE